MEIEISATYDNGANENVDFTELRRLLEGLISISQIGVREMTRIREERVRARLGNCFIFILRSRRYGQYSF